MSDVISDLIAKYGPTMIGVAFTAILGVIGRALLKHLWLRDMLVRLAVEAKAVVMEVQQTYVDRIRYARLDGVLTKDEAAEARRAAIDSLKSNIGPKGLHRLARVLGYDDAGIDRLLDTRIEEQVQRLKLIKSTQLSPVSKDGDSLSPAPVPAPAPPPSSQR